MTKKQAEDFINRIKIYGEELCGRRHVQKIIIGKTVLFLEKNETICDSLLK